MTARAPRILCIDDDTELRGCLSQCLAESGFDVRSAADGPEGIDAFLRDGADAILLDLNLPGMDGVSVCRAIKRLPGGTSAPVIFLTAQSDVPTKVRVLEGGGDDFCAKPFCIEEITARLHVLLRMRDRELRLASETLEFQRLALVDAVTELGNRRAFESSLAREWSKLHRTGRPLGLILADIDQFKTINDQHGHKTGDAILGAVGRALGRAVRRYDSAFRCGGDEFAILLPEVSRPNALAVAERIRVGLASTKVGELSITCSLGLVVAPGPGLRTRIAFVERADQALYEAKAAGRNRVVSAEGPGE